MTYQHKSLASGRWKELSFFDQMANIASELERAFNWQAKGNSSYCQRSFERTLELIDLTLDNLKGFARLKELARMREVIVDYFLGENSFGFSADTLRRYFSNFLYAARKDH
jgi:hypothetical protein